MTDRVSGPKGPIAPRLAVEEKLARQSPGEAPTKMADAFERVQHGRLRELLGGGQREPATGTAAPASGDAAAAPTAEPAASSAPPTGTGKTLSAQILATPLAADPLRLDLAATAKKYIGETEKNLNELFARAEEPDVVLAFDEGDALFGKRTEVKDSHDRFANLEVSHQIERTEAHAGLAPLASNAPAATADDSGSTAETSGESAEADPSRPARDDD